MPIVWCSISAHGFGHAAQVIPIINALGLVCAELQVVLRTCVPPSIFEDYLNVPWDLQPVPQDIGCIQAGPLDIDLNGTWAAYQAFHRDWDERVNQEASAMNKVHPQLVISNISYLAIASAYQAHCPAVAIASLSWDQVLVPYMDWKNEIHSTIYKQICQEYVKATHMIRLYPSIEMPAFPSITDTGPSFPHLGIPSKNVREVLKLEDGEKIVLVAFGGIPLSGLPFKQMESCDGFHFLVGGMSMRESLTRVHPIENFNISFGEFMKQTDVVMTKPGYATITTAVQWGIPIVYVRRNNFVDEDSLVAYAHDYGRAVEMTRKDFDAGVWKKSLERALSLPLSPVPPPTTNLETATRILSNFLKV